MDDKFSLTIKAPREAGAASVIDLRPSWGSRIIQSAKYIATGRVPDWFGPGAPLPPQAPPEVAGREFDYSTAYNLQYSPKYLEGPSYKTLQTLSYSYDLLRLMIETRKDEICKLGWSIAYKDEKKKPDERTKLVQDFFAMPDKEHTWEEWLRLLLEDLLVIDAPTLYPRAARDGSLYSLEPVDGSTIKRVIDDWGRTPQAPAPAFQQILKGLPATDYTRDQLVYRPRNLRANRVYGYSPVEQLFITINIALRRQASMLQYYTEGSTPDLILSVPEGWSPKQVADFKLWWDSILQGNDANKRGTMFVFNGTKAIDTKEKLITNETDEWLARVMCYCFGQSAQPFVKTMNRATAESAATSAKEQGVSTTMSWVVNLMNLLLVKYFEGGADMKFRWEEEDETDAKTKTEIHEKKVKAGAMSINEWREQDGLDPIGPLGDEYRIYTATGAVTLEQADEPPLPPVAPGDGGFPPKPGDKKPDAKKPDAKLGKRLAKALRPITTEERKLATQVAKVLRKVRVDVAASMLKLNLVTKAAGTPKPLTEPDTALSNIDLSGFAELQATVEIALAEVGVEGFAKALEEAGVVEGSDVFALAATRASNYAATRAAELISELESGTKTLIRSTIVEAIDEGWSYPELADALTKDYAFSAERAATIASTEMNDAITQAALEAWKESGVVTGVKWLLSNDEGVCPVCEGNNEEGVVPLGKAFESGDEGPPAHPNCRCSISPVVD